VEAEAAVPSPSRPRSHAVERARELASSTWFLGAVVFLLTWGGGLVAARTISIDDSFHAGLNMATVQGLEFGTDVVVTYGPLGFLKSYLLFYEWPARLAAVYGLALHLALSLSLVWALRRNFGVVVSLLVALVAAVLMRGDLSAIAIRDDAGVVVLAVIWAVAAVTARPPGFVRPLLVYGGAVFAAIELLAKLNTGLIVLAVLAIGLVAMEGRRSRDLAAFAATLVASLVALWIATGQGLDSIGPFLTSSLDVVSGYSAGARLDWGNRDYDYVLFPLVLIACGALAWVASRGLVTLRRLAVLAIFAIVGFTSVKAGLVSHDPFHMATFYGAMLGLAIAMPLPDQTRVRGAAIVALVGIAGAGLTTASDEYPLWDPVANVANAADTVATAAIPGELGDEIDANRAELVAEHALDEETLALLEGHRVHVEPSEASAAWAHELDWDPLPVYQPYIAWTEELDRLNAEALASPDGPDRILRQNLNALGRYPAYESPAAMVAMLCNFEPLRTTERWQVLGRVESRCGEPEPLGTAEAGYGERVAVPEAPPGAAVLARIEDAEDSGLARLVSTLWRGTPQSINFDTGAAPSSTLAGTPHHGYYTFLPATAEDGLLMSAPPDADSPEPFRLAPNAQGFALHLGGSDPAEIDDDPERRFEVEFLAMPIAPNER
jgi:hypothetical protein